jgi:sulfite reductase alpha subunit-like flavoprotein
MPSSPFAKTAPFAEEEIEILNRVVGSANVTHRAWPSGLLSGLDAAAAASQPVSASRAAEPLTILFASESGNCERLAADMAKTARKQGFKPTVIDMADVDVASLATVRRLAVIAATWGEGDPPARAVSAYADLMSEKGIDESEFTKLATAHAQRLYPNMNPAAAFEKLFSDGSEDGVILREAHSISKTAYAAPYFDLQLLVADAQNVDDPSKAIAQLKELGRQKWPTESEEQQFLNAFTDPANAELAAKAHRRPAATTVYPFPR